MTKKSSFDFAAKPIKVAFVDWRMPVWDSWKAEEGCSILHILFLSHADDSIFDTKSTKLWIWTCHMTTVCGGRILIWGAYPCSTSPLIPLKACWQIHLPQHCCCPSVLVYGIDVSVRSWYIQQDSAPFHWARIILEWFTVHDSELQLLECPSSPLLNSIEHFWGEMDRSIQSSRTPLYNLRELKAVILLSSANIPPQCFQKLMLRKIFVVIKARDDSSWYQYWSMI